MSIKIEHVVQLSVRPFECHQLLKIGLQLGISTGATYVGGSYSSRVNVGLQALRALCRE